jgi:hypothetical protein
VYKAAGGRSEGGLQATMFWGGIGAGVGFAAGGAAAGYVRSLMLPDLEGVLGPEVSAADANPGTVYRIGAKSGSFYSDRPFPSLGAAEEEFGAATRPFRSSTYRMTADFGPDVIYRSGTGVTGATQYQVVSGWADVNILSSSLYGLSPAAMSVVTASSGWATATVADYLW